MSICKSFPKIEINKDLKLPKIVFLAGFPDNQTSGWGHVLPEKLASSDHHLIFLCLPGYDLGGSVRPWGYDFDELVEILRVTIDEVVTSPDEQITLIAHDWGCFVSYLYLAKYGSRVSKFVSIDVGIIDLSKMRIKDICLICIYQWWFAFSYLVSQYLGVLVGTLMMALFYLPIFRPVWPTRNERPHVPKESITVDKCYPYYHTWRQVLRGKVPKLKYPSCPTFFLYGAEKNCMFHDESFVERLNGTPGCKAKRIENAGHWLQITQAKLVTTEIMEFLKQ